MASGGSTTHVVKVRRHRQIEAFHPEKLQKSILAACISAGAPTGNARSFAARVTERVEEWTSSRPEVTSNDLRRMAAHYLKPLHPDASYLYEHHRTTI